MHNRINISENASARIRPLYGNYGFWPPNRSLFRDGGDLNKSSVRCVFRENVLYVRNYSCHYRQDSGGAFTGRSTFSLHRGEHCLDARLDSAVYPFLLFSARVVGVGRDDDRQSGVPAAQCRTADRSEVIEESLMERRVQDRYWSGCLCI